MNAYLLDTNIISELVKPQPDVNVIAFLSQAENTYLSAITLHELDYGINLLPQGQRRDKLKQQLSLLLAEYHDYIIPIHHQEATQAAILRATAKQQGYVVHLADALIAGTAKAHELVLATRNSSDFEHLGVTLLNPWKI